MGSQSYQTVVLAPHPDDAAFSVGGTLATGGLASVTVVTVFGKTNYLGHLGFQDTWEQASAIRKREDEAFAAKAGIRLVYCLHPEAALRLAPNEDAIFRANPDAPLNQPPGLRSELNDVVARERPSIVLAPLGIGGHADHLLLQREAAHVARASIATLLYYEDLPYAARLTGQKALHRVRFVCPDYQPLIVKLNEALEEKAARLLLYKTQITESAVADVRRYAFELDLASGAERLWVPPGFDIGRS